MHLITILAADEGGGGGAAIAQLGILLLIPLALYFLMIRPQRRRMREQQALQSALEVGDEVMTTSGVYGFITGFDEDEGGRPFIWLEIDEDVQIRVTRAAIQGKADITATKPETRRSLTKPAATSEDNANGATAATDDAASDATTREG